MMDGLGILWPLSNIFRLPKFVLLSLIDLLLRATNTGISAVIDNYGRVNDHIENNKEGTMNGNIPINFKRSLYSEYGDIFILMLIFFSLLMKVLINWHKYDE